MTPDGCVEVNRFDGACQCGAVRYCVAAGPARQTVCHCRMCQRATGNAFAPLIEVGNERITWTGQAKTYASSNIAERGFCDICGTPLFYRGLGRDSTEFMVGTIDTKIDYRPTANHGVESRLGWVLGLAEIAEKETFFTAGEAVISHQYEHGD
ncbi:MAG: GFA family protein [Pseudomonadota bacterium]